MATLIPATGEPRFVAPATPPAFSLAELQVIVGGYIEALRVPWHIVGPPGDPPEPLWMFLNEHGKYLDLPINRFATSIMRDVIGRDDFIVGDVIVCTPAEAGEEQSDGT